MATSACGVSPRGCNKPHNLIASETQSAGKYKASVAGKRANGAWAQGLGFIL